VSYEGKFDVNFNLYMSVYKWISMNARATNARIEFPSEISYNIRCKCGTLYGTQVGYD